jgi:hypothetical protein
MRASKAMQDGAVCLPVMNRAGSMAAAIVLGALVPCCAFAKDDCGAPAGFASVTKRSDLPAALRENFKDIAMPGEHWNESDVGPPGVGALFIWHREPLWIVEMGRGGIVTILTVRAYKVGADGAVVQDVTLPPRDDTSYCDEARRNAGF